MQLQRTLYVPVEKQSIRKSGAPQANTLFRNAWTETLLSPPEE